MVTDLAHALGELHGAGLFHGGLRPSAVYLAGDTKGGHRVQVAEFGQIFMGGLQYLEAGEHLFYAAPEQLASGDFNEGRGKSWDVYAFGVVAFELLTGHLPRLDRLHHHHRDNPSWLDSAAAITFGELSEVTGYFLAQLQEESEVMWPVANDDGREAGLREVISSCCDSRPLKGRDRWWKWPQGFDSRRRSTFPHRLRRVPARSVPKTWQRSPREQRVPRRWILRRRLPWPDPDSLNHSSVRLRLAAGNGKRARVPGPPQDQSGSPVAAHRDRVLDRFPRPLLRRDRQLPEGARGQEPGRSGTAEGTAGQRQQTGRGLPADAGRAGQEQAIAFGTQRIRRLEKQSSRAGQARAATPP